MGTHRRTATTTVCHRCHGGVPFSGDEPLRITDLHLLLQLLGLDRKKVVDVHNAHFSPRGPPPSSAASSASMTRWRQRVPML